MRGFLGIVKGHTGYTILLFDTSMLQELIEKEPWERIIAMKPI
jgi:hypothetical protein